MIKELLHNAASSTLGAAITATATTLMVADASSFPTSGNFRIIVESELMLVTAVSGTTFTVQRGIESSAASSHAGGAAVTHIITSASLAAYGRQNDPWFESGRPAFALQDANGNALTKANFTAVNQGSATITDQNGTILLSAPASGGTADVVFLSRNAPATPYTVTACLAANCVANGSSVYQRYGLGFRRSADGSLWLPMRECSASYVSNYMLLTYASPTTNPAIKVSRSAWFAERFYFKIGDDGTNITSYVSHDGINWLQVFQESRTAYFTGGPDQVGWFAENNASGNVNLPVTLVHWSGT